MVRWTNGEARLGFDMPDWSPDTVGPHNRFGGLLVVEKDGIADLLIIAGVGERFDLARSSGTRARASRPSFVSPMRSACRYSCCTTSTAPG
jgi:hypothetical protein